MIKKREESMKHAALLTLVTLILLFPACAPPVEESEPTAEEKIAQMNEWLPDVKMELAMQDKYACCLKEGCNQCILAHGSCPCYKNLQEGKPVCGECYGGWHQGRGISDDFSLEDVKLDTTHHH
jgi:hypothetical protein